MTTKEGSQVIAIEEHYLDADVDAKVNKMAGGGEETRKRLTGSRRYPGQGNGRRGH